jgi:hypothetical protein
MALEFGHNNLTVRWAIWRKQVFVIFPRIGGSPAFCVD